ncbi:MAG: small ribosomal subunit Rsm22 family protein [Verrucomicrobiales bacterium]|jgi:ribosomal protein RSM22 (predicted rRNA methylase)|nr:small ribosomal subunit Rsm22 family protein [Verrucomicrobiales bacterium]
MTYPQELETWWLAAAGRQLRLRDPKAIAQRLAERAGQLSDAFTVSRDKNFADCYSDPLTVAAYGNYFFPQTYARAWLTVSELVTRRGWTPPADRPLTVTDLGGGTGAALIAAVDCIAGKFPATRFDTTLVDQSATALKLYRRLARDARKRHLFKSVTVSADLARPAAWSPSAPVDLLIASFSLGEAFHGQPDAAVLDWLAAARARLAAGGLLIIIEPALKETAGRLERLRDVIVSAADRDWHIWSPCPHEKPCPLLAGQKHWCHEVRRWPVPPTVNRINDQLRRSVWDLKYSFLILGQTPPPLTLTNAAGVDQGARCVRLLTPAVSGHGKLLFSGCNAAGEHAEYDILKRRLEKSDEKELATLKRGDLVTLSAVEKLGGQNQYRLASPEFTVSGI